MIAIGVHFPGTNRNVSPRRGSVVDLEGEGVPVIVDDIQARKCVTLRQIMVDPKDALILVDRCRRRGNEAIVRQGGKRQKFRNVVCRNWIYRNFVEGVGVVSRRVYKLGSIRICAVSGSIERSTAQLTKISAPLGLAQHS